MYLLDILVACEDANDLVDKIEPLREMAAGMVFSPSGSATMGLLGFLDAMLYMIVDFFSLMTSDFYMGGRN